LGELAPFPRPLAGSPPKKNVNLSPPKVRGVEKTLIIAINISIFLFIIYTRLNTLEQIKNIGITFHNKFGLDQNINDKINIPINSILVIGKLGVIITKC
jgi:hypothetical protein